MSTVFTKSKKSFFDVAMIPELLKLMKPRVMSLVIFTCAVGLLTAPNSISFTTSALGILIVAVGAGAAGALNMWYEADVDKLMTRTCLRPIPRGSLQKNQALYFGTALSVLSVITLYYVTNLLSASLLLFTILFYVFVYTIWLKRKTPQNIVIGGASGALPPVIGWSIAMNEISLEPIILFLIIFIWTPSHFWALSLYKTEDYKKARIPMLPITSGIKTTKLNIFIYALILFPTALAPYFLNFSGFFYLTLTTVISAYYLFLSYRLLVEKNSTIEKKLATKLFAYSILYLFMIFVFILIDKIV